MVGAGASAAEGVSAGGDVDSAFGAGCGGSRVDLDFFFDLPCELVSLVIIK